MEAVDPGPDTTGRSAARRILELARDLSPCSPATASTARRRCWSTCAVVVAKIQETPKPDDPAGAAAELVMVAPGSGRSSRRRPAASRRPQHRVPSRPGSGPLRPSGDQRPCRRHRRRRRQRGRRRSARDARHLAALPQGRVGPVAALAAIGPRGLFRGPRRSRRDRSVPPRRQRLPLAGC